MERQYYMVVGWGAYGVGLNGSAAFFQWARKVGHVHAGDETITVGTWKVETFDFPPRGDAWSEIELTSQQVSRLHRAACVVAETRHDPGYINELF